MRALHRSMSEKYREGHFGMSSEDFSDNLISIMPIMVIPKRLFIYMS